MDPPVAPKNAIAGGLVSVEEDIAIVLEIDATFQMFYA